MNPLRSPARICSRIGLAFLALIGVWLASAVVIMIPLMLSSYSSGTDILGNLWVILAINDIPLYAIALPVFLLILRGIPDGPAEDRPSPRKVTPGWFLLMVGVSFGAVYLFNYLTSLIQRFTSVFSDLLGGDALDQMLSASDFWPQLIFMVFVPAIGEEFIFRYTLRKKLRGSGDKIYILFSAFCFGLFHMNFSQAFFAFAVGVVFAWVYVKTNKIWVPMALHFCINFYGIISSYIVTSELATLITFIVLAALIVLAIVVFIVSIRRVLREMHPPDEPGWSLRGPAPVPQPAYPPHYAQPYYPPQAYQPPQYYPPQPPRYDPPQYTQPQYPPPYVPPQPYYPPQPYQPPQYYQHQPYQPPYYPPQTAYPPYGYYYQPPAPPRSAASVCLGNVGMILFMVITGLALLFTMFL